MVQDRPWEQYGTLSCFGYFKDGEVRWESGGDVSRLAGKPVRLRFALMDADIYAFKFNKWDLVKNDW